MAYCTSAQVKARNHALLDDAVAGDVSDAMAKAQGIVDGMLRKWYAVPLSSVPDEIVGISADLAASFLLSDIVGNAGRDDDPTQADNLYKKAMDLLKMINDGDFLLDIPDPTEEASVMKQARCNTYSSTSYQSFRSWNPSDPTTYS